MYSVLQIASGSAGLRNAFGLVAASGAAAPGMPHAFGGPAEGMVSGTRIATATGWRPVEAVMPGEAVMTLDAGLQKVVRVASSPLWNAVTPMPRHLWPLAVPRGAIGNLRRLSLLPEEMLVLESDTAEEVCGDPFVLMPASALQGFWGIAREVPVAPVRVVTLWFERGQVVPVRSGALIHCPSACAVREAMLGEAPDYPTLGHAQAVWLLDLMRERGERPDGASAVLAVQAALGEDRPNLP